MRGLAQLTPSLSEPSRSWPWPMSPPSVVAPRCRGRPGGWRRCCPFRCHPRACRTVDSLLGSRVGRAVSAAPDHNSAVAFGSGPPVRRNDP
jgi:hypothetical protein